ncbi:MAG TPA: glycine cleavage T C-terminal barrel domain-containing protein [Myxococcota bacterium]|jgi:folate-binding protein YgfZ
MSAGEQALRCRQGAGLFRLEGRGLVAVEGADRVRWLNGMLSNDVATLAAGRERSGCYALLLSRIGRILADVHVLLREGSFWLETEQAAVAPLLATLGKYIIADDVRLTEIGAAWERLALEGPAAGAVFAIAAGEAPGLAPDAADAFAIAGAPVLAGAWGVSGEEALQLFAPVGSGAAVAQALRQAGAGHGLVEAGEDVLEVLRVEAGTPRYGRELSEAVLPAEVGLVRAISTTKGCYTGQEIVARMATRGGASHALVGLALAGVFVPAPGARVSEQAAPVGEVTSAALSASAGAIALAFVRRAHAAPGAELAVEGRAARVTPLPFVPPRSRPP